MTAVFATKKKQERVIKEYRAAEGGIQTINHLEEHLAKMQHSALQRGQQDKDQPAT